MRSMSIRELRDSLASLQEIVEREGEIVVTRHGRGLARLVPVQPKRGVPSHADLRASMPLMAVGSEELLRADRERG
jgi:prevent-host-death family protein